jgi:hypothetical protein
VTNKNIIYLQNHDIATAGEMRILINTEALCEFTPKNHRHQLFWQIKYSPYRTYRGPWGQELVFWDFKSAAFVRTPESRAWVIRQHISDLLFG